MSIADIQTAGSAVRKRNLLVLDTRDDSSIEDAENAYVATVSRFADWTPGHREQVAALITRKTVRAASWYASTARDHVASELAVFSDEARRVANGAEPVAPDEAAIRALADGFVLRLDLILSTSQSVPGALAAEAHQVGRIVQTESFVAYSRARAAATQRLVERGDRGDYRIPTSLSGARDARDWVVGIVKIWDALLDKRVCPRCAALASSIRPLGMPFDGEPDPPLHSRCRCVVGFWPVAVPKNK